jgi:hypothetical protein
MDLGHHEPMPIGTGFQKAEQPATEPGPKSAVGASRPRSPNYPLITLERALGVAETVYAEEKRFIVPMATVCSRAGLGGGKSGTAIRILSALKKYGIFEEREGVFHMTEAAKNYVLAPTNPDLRLSIRREMARQYEEVTQVLTHFPNGLPDDEPLNRYFVVERGFTPSGASEFTGIIKEIVSFANLYEGGHTDPMPSPTVEEKANSSATMNSLLNIFPPSPPKPGVSVFSIDGATIEIRSSIPLDQMTERQLRRLIRFLQVHEENAKEDGRAQ